MKNGQDETYTQQNRSPAPHRQTPDRPRQPEEIARNATNGDPTRTQHRINGTSRLSAKLDQGKPRRSRNSRRRSAPQPVHRATRQGTITSSRSHGRGTARHQGIAPRGPSSTVQTRPNGDPPKTPHSLSRTSRFPAERDQATPGTSRVSRCASGRRPVRGGTRQGAIAASRSAPGHRRADRRTRPNSQGTTTSSGVGTISRLTLKGRSKTPRTPRSPPYRLRSDPQSRTAHQPRTAKRRNGPDSHRRSPVTPPMAIRPGRSTGQTGRAG